MKKSLLLLCMIFTIGYLSAQNNKDDNGKKSKTFESNRDRIVLDLTFDNWFYQTNSSTGDFKTEWFSRGAGLYAMYDFQFGESVVSFAPGIGIQSSSLYINKEFAQDTLGITIVMSESRSLRKNKLALTYLEIPLELRFRSKPKENKKSFKVGIGFKGGYLIDSHTKVKFKQDNTMRKFKKKNIANLLHYRYGPTFRIGYGPVNFLAFYGLSRIFEKDKGGIDASPFSLGISINGL